MMKTLSLIFLSCLIFSFCGFEVSDGEDHGNILDTEAGLILVESEHRIGWGQSNCLLCHQADNIHRVNRTGLGSVDVEEIQDQVLDQGVSICSTCHGTNGVK